MFNVNIEFYDKSENGCSSDDGFKFKNSRQLFSNWSLKWLKVTKNGKNKSTSDSFPISGLSKFY